MANEVELQDRHASGSPRGRAATAERPGTIFGRAGACGAGDSARRSGAGFDQLEQRRACLTYLAWRCRHSSASIRAITSSPPSSAPRRAGAAPARGHVLLDHLQVVQVPSVSWARLSVLTSGRTGASRESATSSSA